MTKIEGISNTLNESSSHYASVAYWGIYLTWTFEVVHVPDLLDLIIDNHG